MRSIINKMNKNKFYTYGIIVLIIIFILTLIQNFWTQYASDDWCYMYIYDHLGNPTDTSKRVKSIFDVIVSMKNHWNLWGGRVVAHGLLQLVLATSYPGFHKVIFNIVNAVMYVALGFVIYKHATYKRQNSVVLLIGIYAMMWFFIPQYGATVLWASGAANYLWCSVIILTYLLPYRMYAVNSENVMKDSVKNAVVMGILGLFAGCTNENSGGALALMCIMFILLYKYYKIKIPKWSLSGVCGTIIGAIVLIIAPGNYRFPNDTSLAELINRLKNVCEISHKLLFGLSLIMLAVLFLIWFTSCATRKDTTDETGENARPNIMLPVLYIVGAAASILVLVISSARPERTWFIGICLIITAIGYMYECINFKVLPRHFVPVSCIGIAVICSISYYTTMGSIHGSYLLTKEQEITIATAAKSGQKSASIKVAPRSDCKHDILYWEYGVSHFESSPDTWVNAWASAYYGLDSISSTD